MNSILQLLFGIRFIYRKNTFGLLIGILYGLDHFRFYSEKELYMKSKFKVLYQKISKN